MFPFLTLAAEGSNNVLLLPDKRNLITICHIVFLAIIRSHFTFILAIFNVLFDFYNKSKEGSWKEYLCAQDLGTMTNHPKKTTLWLCYTSFKMYQVISRGIVTTVACLTCSLSCASQS